MTLKDARLLRDKIIAELGCHCVVPLGHGPENYFARIWSIYADKPNGPQDFNSDAEFAAWLDRRIVAIAKEKKELEERRKKRMRSPLEIMIDRACGIE